MYEEELEALRTEVAESDRVLKCEQSSRSEQISQLLAAHESQIKQLVIQNADEYSNSKVAQLQSKVSSQEVMLLHPPLLRTCDPADLKNKKDRI